MKEEKTQGISPEKTRKDSYNTNKKAKETELLDLRAGYVQHTSPNFPNISLILNVLVIAKNCPVRMKNTYSWAPILKSF